MICFIISCVILKITIVYAISKELRVEFDLYYENEGGFTMTKNYQYDSVENLKISSMLAVDLRLLYYVERAILIIGPSTNGSESQLRELKLEYFNRKNLISVPCTLSMLGSENLLFECNNIGRVLKVEGTFIFQKLFLIGYDTFYDKLIGCYEAIIAQPSRILGFSSLESCIDECRNTSLQFAAVNKDFWKTCKCLPSMKDLFIENLFNCDSFCDIFSYQLCGGGELYSVYSTDDSLRRRQVETTWECIYNLTNCPRCAVARYGYNCDTFECRINNGGCSPLLCQSWDKGSMQRESCICAEGFILAQNICIDVNECENPLTCGERSHRCINSRGSFYCICRKGHIMVRNRTCVDIDECSSGHKCDTDTMYCTNIPESYQCTCKSGYRNTSNPFRCRDFNECETGKHKCDNSSLCVNTAGSYTCECPENAKVIITRDGIRCETPSRMMYLLVAAAATFGAYLFLACLILKGGPNASSRKRLSIKSTPSGSENVLQKIDRIPSEQKALQNLEK